MISVNNVTKSFGTRILFENVNVKFTPGNRYGLTGPNGAGKSTFMKILTGDIDPTNAGVIVRPKKVGVLRQDQFAFDNELIVDTVMMGNKILWSAFKDRDAIVDAGDYSEENLKKLEDLENIIADENGYMAEIEAEEILRGIGLEDARHRDLMSTLPTDMKFRVLLAQAVFGNPQALLLDEPTNYMDLEAIHWLESFLADYDGTMIVISHDRHFLNAVCTHIADIDYETIILYPGNYDDMVEQKLSSRSRVESENRDKMKKITQLQEFIARFGAGQRASQAQARRKEVARLQPQELKRSNIQRPYIRFDQIKPGGKDVVAFKGLTKSFDGKTLFKDFNAEVLRGERIAIIGSNGAGKTTLIKCLTGEVQPDAGEVKWGASVEWSYYPQDATDLIPPGYTVADWLITYDISADGVQAVRSVLGRMLFQGDDGLKPTSGISGGETARLLMAKMMLEKKPVLIFDEPTNHLDLEAVNALGDGLSQFPGGIFLVSHDRDLISDAATRIWSFQNGTIIDFRGTYEEFLQKYPLPETHQKKRGR